MSKLYYDLYCDESGTDKNNFYFGAIHCSRARANILEKEILAFRIRTGLNGEMKWTKVSKRMLAEYTEFTDIFLNDLYTTFILSRISKGEYWRKLATSNDSRFLHAYFHFLEQAMKGYARYAVFLDETSSKPYKFKSFHYALNLPDIKYHRQKKVHTFKTICSHESNLIQLTDVLLGALSSTPESLHKTTLSNHVQEKMKASTKYGRPKLIVYDWAAPETRRFKPSL